MKIRNHIRFGPVIVLILIVALFSRCKKDPATDPVVPPVVSKVQFLGHKGSGSTLVNPSLIENTLPSIQNGLSTLTGVELDLQMSLDGTLWVYHDFNLADESCTPIASKALILSRDSEISKINVCSPKAQDRIYRFSEIMTYWNQAATPFYISIHIKLDFPPDSIDKPIIGGEALYLSKMADNLAKIIPSVKDPGKIILEVYDATFCKKIHQLIPGMKVCLIKYVPFPKQIESALASGYDGVSAIFTNPELTVDEVKRAHSKNLFVQLWTPNTKAELTAAYNFLPDFIQTDNLDALKDLNLSAK